MNKLKYYVELFKLKQTFLLVLSGIFGYLIAAGTNINLFTLILFIVASILSVSGTTGLNMYYDRDIDAIMFRTHLRPLPQNKIKSKEAYGVSLIFTVLGVGIAFLINPWVGFAILTGFIVDVYVYTVMLKRKTPINIAIGAIAGGMPIFGGFLAYTGAFDIRALILASVVAVWAMLHIWFIAIYYLDDYRRANIPMLPVVIGERKTIFSIIIGIGVIQILFLILWLMGIAGSFTIIVSLAFTTVLTLLCINFLKTNEKRWTRYGYKVLSPYLGVTLLVIILERMSVLPTLF